MIRRFAFIVMAFITVVSSGGAIFLSSNNVSALSGTDFRPGRIIDDAIFFNKDAMSAAQIQQFLNAKLPVCDRMRPSSNPSYQPPYTCLNEYLENTTTKENNYGRFDAAGRPIQIAGGKSAAQIIWDAGQQYGINPQVLIVMLQKEQSLITDNWPWKIQYDRAMGYACPDSGPNGTANCNASYYGFYNQLDSAAWQLKRYVERPSDFNFRGGVSRYIQYSPNAACGASNVYLENAATAALYNYTPYQPNTAALNNLYGTGDGCSAYGNRNFWRMFNDWFGTTYATVYNGVDYSPVFNAQYYLSNNLDLASVFGSDYLAAFNHFILRGMDEGRQANENFNVTSYKNRYQDLRLSFGKTLPSYYLHYVVTGRFENRTATGAADIAYITNYKGIDYSVVYDYTAYLAKYADINQLYSNDDAGAIKQFIAYGMKEGRIGNDSFDVNSYRKRYYDLRNVFGTSLDAYYMHYINAGKSEGRIATGDYVGGTTKLNGINYSPVYELNYYESKYSDIKNAFGLDDKQALGHFIDFGMQEGRSASANFDVNIYRNRYPDLQAAYGDNLKLYYTHYILYGAKEGRLGI